MVDFSVETVGVWVVVTKEKTRRSAMANKPHDSCASVAHTVVPQQHSYVNSFKVYLHQCCYQGLTSWGRKQELKFQRAGMTEIISKQSPQHQSLHSRQLQLKSSGQLSGETSSIPVQYATFSLFNKLCLSLCYNLLLWVSLSRRCIWAMSKLLKDCDIPTVFLQT